MDDDKQIVKKEDYILYWRLESEFVRWHLGR